jgi:chitodextrinase
MIRTKVTILVLLGALVFGFAGMSLLPERAFAAACTAPSTDYGTVTSSVSIASAATYRVWSRVLAPDTSNNTYLLEIDGSGCYTVGGSNIPANSWIWVAHQGGNLNSKIDVALSKGTHTLKFIGNKPGFELDRVVFSSDTACTPTGSAGTNCNTTADASAPSVKLKTPTSGSTVGGLTTVSATASDDVGVTKVDFYVDSTLRASDTSSPYSFQWDTGLVINGRHTLIVKAYDAAGNVSTDSFNVTVANGDKQAPTAPSELKATASSYNAVDLSWKPSTDNAGIRSYTVYRDGVPIAQPTGTTYQDTGLFSSTSYSYKIQATDTSSNVSGFSDTVTVKTPATADSQAPTTPADVVATAVSPGQIDVSWTPSTDNIGVKGYDIYRAVKGGKAAKIAETSGTTFGDSLVEPGTTYAYTVRARDANGNTSSFSAAATATTPQAVKHHSRVQGVVSDARTGQPIVGGRVLVISGSTTHTYTTDSKGRYSFRNLQPGSYSLSFQNDGYASKSVTLKIKGGITVYNVKLSKR